MSDDPRPGDDPLGSVAEEAAKLFGALSDWAREHGPATGTGGATECTFCPLCRTVHAVRQASPEVRQHLTVAAASLAQAAAGFLATVVPDEGRAGRAPGGGTAGGVEHIDLDDDPGEQP